MTEAEGNAAAYHRGLDQEAPAIDQPRPTARGVFANVPWQVMAIAAAVTVGLLLLSPLYGWHRDELYFVVAGRHPAFGYPDQPALTPLLSAAAVALLGLSPTSVRILPALVVGALILISALMARDMGGTRRAMVLAALVAAISGLLAAGHLDATATYDLLAWALVVWLVIRLLAGSDPRLWLVVGITAGIALENKHIILFLGAGLASGLLLARRWEVIRSPWAWAALLIAVVLWLPNLAWQAANGFPQLEMAAAISSGERVKIPIELTLLAGPLLFPVSVAGAWWLFRSPAAQPWRALAWTAILVVFLDLVVGGKSYYAAGLLPLLMAAGSIPLDGWLSRGRTRLRTWLFAVAALVSGLIAALLVLPIVPASSLGQTPIPGIYKESAEQIGWPDLASAVERSVAELTADQRARAIIFTDNYGQAGAVELLGRDLPRVYSGHNGYWDWGPPPDDRTVTIVVGRGAINADQAQECRRTATVDNGVGVNNAEQGTPIFVCDRVLRPWSQAWRSLRHLD